MPGGGGIGGMARALLGLTASAAAAALTNPYLLAAAAAAGIAFGAFKLFQSSVKQTGELDRYAQSLGLTKKEMEKLGPVGITVGDTMKGLWKTVSDAAQASAEINHYGNLASAAKGFFKEGSDGYKALLAAEKVFRAFELAIAIKNAAVKIGLIGAQTAAKVTSDTAMAASDTARAGVEQGNSIITTGIKAVEAVVNAIRDH